MVGKSRICCRLLFLCCNHGVTAALRAAAEDAVYLAAASPGCTPVHFLACLYIWNLCVEWRPGEDLNL